jgi:hypothetical protein
VVVSNPSQRRALQNYRNRLARRDMARFEVIGLNTDRELIRRLSRRLAENDTDAAHLRATVRRAIAGEPPKRGGILAALRRSPLVGADLELTRAAEPGRTAAL